MRDEPQRVGVGRTAEVIAVSPTLVIRRDLRGRDAAPAARLLHALREAGVPVPRVHGADGPDLLLERIDGPDLLARMASGEVDPVEGLRILGSLHRALDGVAAPEWLPPADDADAGCATLAHLDLHPANVLIGPDGPVLIDWDNARRAPRALDVALSVVIVRAAPAAADLLGARIDEGVAALIDASGADPEPELARAARRRLADPGAGDAERAIVARFLDG